MRRVPPALLLALGLIATVVLGSSSPAAARPAQTSSEIVISLSSAHDTAAQTCDLAWNFSNTTSKPVRGYAVAISHTPLKVGKSIPGHNILVPSANGYVDNDLPEGATSYFYVQAFYMDNKTSKVASASSTCG